MPSEIPAAMTADEFWGLFGRREHAGLDFKRGVPKGILHTIPAMAMTDGGLIVHGVTDEREIVGCRLSQRVQDQITRYAHQCDLDVQLQSVLVDGLELTLTHVPAIRGRIVTTPDGRLLRRVGGDSQPIRGDALRRFVVARTERPGEEEAVLSIDVGDLDLATVNRALTADGRPAVDRTEVASALVDLGVANRSGGSSLQLLRAGAVLFASDPTKDMAGARVQFVRRVGIGPGMGPSSAREQVSGPLPLVVDRCLDLVSQHTQSFEAVMGSRREIIPEYPLEVLREAVVNALAHRDYWLSGATVDITVWDDRVEVTSPGPLPGHITVENMRAEHYSRNSRIMRVLKILGLVEEYGEGVDRMFQGMESRLLEPPTFDATPDSVTVRLLNRALVDVEDQAWLQLFADYTLTVAERRALVAARSAGSITPRSLRTLIPSANVDAVLAGATAKGLLTRVGVRGGARYVLSEEVVLRAGATGIQARSRQQKMLLDEMDRQGSISTLEGSELLKEPMTVVRDLLNNLVLAGAASAEGRTRARRYYPND